MTGDELRLLLMAALPRVAEARDELRELEAAIGDGDLGVTVGDGALVGDAELVGGRDADELGLGADVGTGSGWQPTSPRQSTATAAAPAAAR